MPLAPAASEGGGRRAESFAFKPGRVGARRSKSSSSSESFSSSYYEATFSESMAEKRRHRDGPSSSGMTTPPPPTTLPAGSASGPPPGLSGPQVFDIGENPRKRKLEPLAMRPRICRIQCAQVMDEALFSLETLVRTFDADNTTVDGSVVYFKTRPRRGAVRMMLRDAIHPKLRIYYKQRNFYIRLPRGWMEQRSQAQAQAVPKAAANATSRRPPRHRHAQQKQTP